MKILHAADVHLGASGSAFGDLARARSGEVLDAFRRLPDIAAEERVDAVVLAGDLFDGPKPPRDAMGAVRETLRRLVDLCVPVFMVPGTHDSITLRLDPYRELARASRVVVQSGEERPDRPWPVADERGRQLAAKHSVYILAAPRFGEPVHIQTDAGPLHVYGIAYDPAECRDPLATFDRADAAGVHLAVLHAAIGRQPDGDRPGSGLTVAPESLASLRVDYIALGGHHDPLPPDAFDGVPACYPGSFAARDLSETGTRGFVLAEIEAGAPPTVEHRDGGTRQVVDLEVDVTGCPAEERVAAAVEERVPQASIPAVRLVGEPSFPLDGQAVEAVLSGRFGHAEVVDATRYYASARLDDLAELDTVAGHVVRLGRQRIEAASPGTERQTARLALRAALRALEVD